MENLNTGFTVMVIGMSTVFVFLAVMIVAINITTKIIRIINKYFPEPTEEPKNIQKKKTNNDAEIALAIAVAIQNKQKARE